MEIANIEIIIVRDTIEVRVKIEARSDITTTPYIS